MSPTLTIVALWVAFAASHMALSSLSLRPRIVASIGARPFLGLYSLIALVLFVPMVWVYFAHKHEGPMLWSVAMTPAIEAGVTVVMGVAVVLLVAGILTPSPASMSAPATEPVVLRGVHYITRHAVFMALGLFGIAHLVPNGFASDVAFFAGFPIFAVVGALHQDRRKLATESDRYAAFHAATPLLPFTGREAIRGIRELSPVAYVVGIGLAFVLRYFHGALFG